MSKDAILGAVVVAQLVERSLPTPEMRRSNPDMGKILSTIHIIEKTKIKKKEAGNGPSLKQDPILVITQKQRNSYLLP